MLRFTRINDNLTISAIYNYTWRNLNTRFTNCDRDCLPSKIYISQRKAYKRDGNHEGWSSSPYESIIVQSFSYPQYGEYQRIVNKKRGYKKQRRIQHQYDIFLAIQLVDIGNGNKGYSFWKSKIIWRVGSHTKYPKNIPQNQVKTIHSETREQLNRKYKKLSESERKKAVAKEIEKIKKRATYLSDGDYVSRKFGLNGDNYFRDYPLQEKFGCLYGRSYHKDMPKNIDMPFFCKHALCCLNMLLKKGILKT